MAKKSKRFRKDSEQVAGKEALPLNEAVKILKSFDSTKFDQSVEIAMRLGIDSKQADQIVRGSLVLPHGIGKSQRVIVFAKGDFRPSGPDSRAAWFDAVAKSWDGDSRRGQRGQGVQGGQGRVS